MSSDPEAKSHRSDQSGQAAAQADTPPVLEIRRPERRTTGFVYNTPHSGTYYPPDLLKATRLPLDVLRSSEDCMVDRLFEAAPGLGAPLLMVQFARAYVDSNREPLELDPSLFAGTLPPEANSRSERVRAGLGTIPAVVAANRAIYGEPIPIAEGLGRIARVYQPIHEALGALVAEARRTFGYAVLIDCHSMPSGRTLGRLAPRVTGDIVLGDHHGVSCAPALIDCAASILRDLGYRVALNSPYSGGYNTQNYGRPPDGLHALQIEINRAIYLDEASFTPNAGFDGLADDLRQWMERLHALPAELLRPAAGDQVWRQSAE